MTYQVISEPCHYIGSSTEVKPAAPAVGSHYRETDTRNLYQFSTEWVRLNPRPKTVTFSVYDGLTLPNSTAWYSAGSVVSESVASVLTFSGDNFETFIGQSLSILGVRIMMVGSTGVPRGCGGYRLHLYNGTVTPIADRASFSIAAPTRYYYRGWIPIDAPTKFGETIYGIGKNCDYPIRLLSSSFYGILQCQSSEAPSASATYYIALDGMVI